MTIALPVASQLEDRRVELRWSQSHLASVAGYHVNTVHRVLRGGRVNLETIIDIAQALGFTVTISYDRSDAIPYDRSDVA